MKYESQPLLFALRLPVDSKKSTVDDVAVLGGDGVENPVTPYALKVNAKDCGAVHGTYTGNEPVSGLNVVTWIIDAAGKLRHNLGERTF